MTRERMSVAELDELECEEKIVRDRNFDHAKEPLRPVVDQAIEEIGDDAHVVQALLNTVADIAIERCSYPGDPIKWALYMAGSFLGRREGEVFNPSLRRYGQSR